MAKKKPKTLNIHDTTRIDNYYWLNERDNPEVLEYLKKENAYFDAKMKPTEALQETLFNEMKGRIKQTDMSVPYKKNGYWYYTRYEKGQEYPLYCRKPGDTNALEEVMLDVNDLARGKSYYQVGRSKISLDNKLLAFSVDTFSRRIYSIFIKNLEAGEIFKEEIKGTSGNMVWANDNKTIFYTTKDESLRPAKVFKHLLGTDPENDKLVYTEDDPTFNVYINKSKSDQYIFISSSSTLSDEVRFIDANLPDSEFRPVQVRTKNLEYNVAHFGDYFYIKTNLDALNFKLVKTPVDHPSIENWEDVIPGREDVFLEDFEIFSKYLVLDERINGLTNFRVINWETGKEHYVEMTESTYSAGISINTDFESMQLRYSYSSFVTPSSVYEYNMETQQQKLLKQQEVLGDYNPDNYIVRREYAIARDGVEIPVSIILNKNFKRAGNNSLLLYGYGSYGYSIDAGFNSVRLSLLDRGFVFAIAHVRGGSEMGRQWYEDGKLMKKMNTFTDFIDCAEYLIARSYTNKDHIYAMGGSAGGLLIGAVVNLRPDLFHGVIAAVPFVDVVTTMLDESIPLTTAEYDEWGNPNIKKYYDYMMTYSPYDNVRAVAYPDMLVTTGLHDSQVQYFEPAKWVAKMRQMKTGDNCLLLHVNMEAGHSGTTGRFKRLKETALEYAYLLYCEGILK